MTIVEVLQHVHQDIDALFQEVEGASVANKHRVAREVFRKLSNRLIACMRAEHAVVYPHLAFAHLAAEVELATREHARIEGEINQIRLGAMPPELWRARVKSLRQRVADHAISEKWVVFPIATLMLLARRAQTIANDFQRLQASLPPSVAEPFRSRDTMA
jgi:hypothetical protein